jgi:hypothetical protein
VIDGALLNGDVISEVAALLDRAPDLLDPYAPDCDDLYSRAEGIDMTRETVMPRRITRAKSAARSKRGRVIAFPAPGAFHLPRR